MRVPITDALVTQTSDALKAARALGQAGRIPPPLIDSLKCPRCSLAPICLPDETLAALALEEDDADEQLALFDGSVDAEQAPVADRLDTVRRLMPARDDLRPAYVTGYALSVAKSGGCLQVKEKGKRQSPGTRSGLSLPKICCSRSFSGG